MGLPYGSDAGTIHQWVVHETGETHQTYCEKYGTSGIEDIARLNLLVREAAASTWTPFDIDHQWPGNQHFQILVTSTGDLPKIDPMWQRLYLGCLLD